MKLLVEQHNYTYTRKIINNTESTSKSTWEIALNLTTTSSSIMIKQRIT